MAKQTFTTGQVLTASQMTSLQATALGGGAATAKTASYVLVAADAGTTVAMNAAGATTITVNTALFAAGDTVFIQNLGAGACTVTAGTATVSTAGSLVLAQNQGGELYFTSASASIFFQYATPASSGDIEGVTAGTGISGGGTSGTVTVTNSMATAIDAKGDLVVGTGADAFSRLAVGTNTHVLTADSAEATGLKWAAAGGGGVTFAGASVKMTAGQVISNATDTTLNWNTENWDTNSYHDNATNNSRLTIPSGKGGYYAITAQIRWDTGTTGERVVKLAKNGTVFSVIAMQPWSGAPSVIMSVVTEAAVADYLQLIVYQNNGSSQTLDFEQTLFQASYLGA